MNNKSDELEEILILKRDILELVTPLKEFVITLRNNEIREWLNEDMDTYLNDLNDHVNIITENVENLFFKGNELIQLYHTTISVWLNEIMKILTMISTIIIPLSFLVWLYGVNFEIIPELKWQYGYYIWLFFMFLIICGVEYFFKKKKWW